MNSSAGCCAARSARRSTSAWPRTCSPAGRSSSATSSIDPAEQVFRHELPDGSDVQALFDRVCALHCEASRSLPPAVGGARLRRACGRSRRPLLQDAPRADRRHRLHQRHPEHRVAHGFGARVRRRSGGIAAGRARGGAVAHGNPRRRTAAHGLAAGRTAGDLARLVWHLGRRDLGLGKGMATPFVATPDVLKAPPSPNRVMAHCSLPLARVRAVARRADCQDQRRAAGDARHRAEPLPRGARSARAATAGRRHARRAARRRRRRQSHHDPAGAHGPPRRDARRTARRHRGRDTAR